MLAAAVLVELMCQLVQMGGVLVLPLAITGLMASLKLLELACAILHQVSERWHEQPRRPPGPPPVVMGLPDDQFRAEFRFRKCEINELAELLRIPPIVKGKHGNKVDRVTALCYVLKRYAYPNRVTVDMPWFFKRSQGHIRDIIMEVEETLMSHWGNKIVFDTNLVAALRDRYADANYRASGNRIYSCIGFIDGTVRATCKPIIHQTQFTAATSACTQSSTRVSPHRMG